MYDSSRETLVHANYYYLLLSLRHVARVVTVGRCLHDTVSLQYRYPWHIAHSETHGFRATRRSLAALFLKVESKWNFATTFLYCSLLNTLLLNLVHCTRSFARPTRTW